MLNWLMEQTILISLIAVILLISHKQILKHLGAHHTYALWLVVPMLLISSAIIHLVPNLLSNSRIIQLEHYRVLADKTLADSELFLSASTLLAIWSIGLIVMLLVIGLQAIKLKHLIAHSSPFVMPEARLPIIQHREIHSPMLVGLRRPNIIVPLGFELLTVNQQAAVIEHEQYHHHRGDIALNIIAYRRFRDDQELACDAQITASMSTNEKIAYSRALLTYSQQAHIGMLHTHYGNKHILKERILQMKKQHGKSTLAIVGLTLGLGFASLMLNQQVQAGDHNDSAHAAKKQPIYPLTRVEPKYPKAAVNANQNGFVQLEFDIKKSGVVSNVLVIKSSPKGVFDKQAVKALKQWTYKKSKQGEKSVQVQLDFIIDEPAADVERIKVTANKSV
ncbi:M56 family metallopeptidase [Shewanella sp. D64]|uniref:M56 family metallopeptidase n=1 Tax=unclassified Shewanella TaxID=196818 RepID=UPI0022BA309F|nr:MULTISPECIES: M56 family metallopeptidase [unclassified Shewanella]MEC4725138.1 M56 family metallopeptidase [Shewanella sp. D64]MEC4737039.1 M56 family metallopeptidase [Shewanella sp. E94]WBJ96626.1 M56 family metallopeptidase [Shewanella sp. MTB7]